MEEEKKGKIFDRRLIIRLWAYLGRHKWFIYIAGFLAICGAGLELFLPYLSKTAIDNYIVVTVRKVTLSESERIEVERKITKNLLEIKSGLFVISSSDINKLDRRFTFNLEKSGKLSLEKFYLVKESKKITKVLKNVPTTKIQGFYLISYENLKKLDRSALVILRGADLHGVRKIALIYLSMLIIAFFVMFGEIFLLVFAGQMVMYNLRLKLFSHLQSLKISFFDKNPIGRLVTRATNDVERVNELFTDVLVGFFRDGFILLGAIVVMLKLNSRLALVTFILVPFIVWITALFRIKVRDVYRIVRIKLAKINSSLNENITGIRVIQLFTREKKNYKDFGKINQDYFSTNMRQIVIYAIFRPLIDLFASSGTALIIWYGGFSVIHNVLSLGTLVAFLSYLRLFFRPIRDVSERFNIMEAAMAASERIFLLLDTKEAEDKGGEYIPTSLKGNIDFKNVWFRYGEEWVLKDVSFSVREGERIAIVGPTGAGKTSLISLLPLFYELEKGEISIDGISIKKYDMPFLRRNIGIVMQDTFLFAGNIKDNIRLKDNISDTEIIKAAKYVNAARFIERMPNKYDEDVKERGVTLSGGQRQLLAFARALAQNPRILILDEATSSVDSETEKLIQDATQKLLRGRTSIVIAHRLSTIKNVDRILVIHKGRIVEEGRHQELIKKRGLYYALYNLQYMG